MAHEFDKQDPRPWQAGFADGLAGRRSPAANQHTYRAGYLAGSAQRISRRTMMAAALATVAVPNAAGAAANPEFDPIFAAIDQHRQAWAALNNAGSDVEHRHWHETLLAAENQLVDARPTTTAGVVALREYHREVRRRGGTYQLPPPSYQYWGGGKG